MRFDRRTLLGVTALLTFAPVGVNAQDEEQDPAWVLLAGGQPTDPVGRWRHTLVVDTWNNRLILVGGEDTDGIARGDFWTFDLPNWTWAELDLSGPKARAGSAAAIALDGSGFYYFGGNSNDIVFDDLWWFDFGTSVWRQIETGPGPEARTDTRGAVDALGRFVISHGRNGDRIFDDTWAFDPSAGAWTALSSTGGVGPAARFDHDLVSLPDFGVILLGYGSPDGTESELLGDLWVYDVYNDFWSEVTPAIGPTPRTGAAIARLGNTVVLVGGQSALGLHSDVWEGSFFDTGFAWIELTPVNHGPLGIYRRAWHDMTAANGEYYVFGGDGVEGALSDLWKFSPERIEHPGEDSDYIEPSDG